MKYTSKITLNNPQLIFHFHFSLCCESFGKFSLFEDL